MPDVYPLASFSIQQQQFDDTASVESFVHVDAIRVYFVLEVQLRKRKERAVHL